MYNGEEDEFRTSDEDYMRELYLKFRKEIESGASEEYYELNELLDIYDYAQDEGDILVQMYVFMTASRLHPRAHDFDERIGFFLSYIAPEAAMDLLDRKGREDTALWDVLAIGLKCYPSGDPREMIEKLLAKYSRLDTETTLKLIDMLREFNRPDLLSEFYPEISKRAEDPRGLAFEVAEALKESDQYLEHARKIAEELTAMEPFNVEAWLLSARLEFSLEHPDEALAAVDYALAIDPDNRNAKITRSVIMVAMDSKREEAISVMREILQTEPDNPFALEALAEAYKREGRGKQAAEHYVQIIKNKVFISTDPYVGLVESDPDNIERNLREVGVDANPKKWDERFATLNEKGKAAAGVEMLRAVFWINPEAIDIMSVLDVLYSAGRYKEFVDVYETGRATVKEDGETAVARIPMVAYICVATAYLKIGNKERAAQISRWLMDVEITSQDFNELMRLRGIKLTARLINTVASTDTLAEEEIALFDPFISLL